MMVLVNVSAPGDMIGKTHFQNDMICSDMKSGLLVTILTDHLVDDIREEIVASDILLRSKPRVAVRKISLSQLKNYTRIFYQTCHA